MEKILEIVDEFKTCPLMENQSENFVLKLDENNSNKVDVSFDIVSANYNTGTVNISMEKLDESLVFCHVHTKFHDCTATVNLGHLYNYIALVAAETEENLC